MSKNVNIVKNKWTDFLKGETFWYVVVFIILAGFYLYATKPAIPQVDYINYSGEEE